MEQHCKILYRMKNVFMINSHTTFLTVMGTIDYLHLLPVDVILICVRNYKNEHLKDYPNVIDASKLSDESSVMWNHDLNRIGRLKYIKKVDEFINMKIGESYHLFAPHLAHPFWQLFYTNNKCEFFSYVQEGTLPFTKCFVTKTPIKGKIQNIVYKLLFTRRTWYYRPWFLKDSIKDLSKVDAYTTNDKFFKYLPVEKKYVKWPSQNIKTEFLPDHRIFIYDAFVSNSIMISDDYITMCKKLVDEYAEKNNYLKFHPGQSEEEKEIIKNYFASKGLNYIVLDNSIPFEYVIMQEKNLHLVGFGSSLLFLAHDYGHHVICRDDDLLQFRRYKNYRNLCGFMSFHEYSKSSN